MGKKADRRAARIQAAKERESEVRVYTNWERANIAFYLAFGHRGMMEKYSAEDSIEACNEAIYTFFEVLYTLPNRNPLRREFETLTELLIWFNIEYPVCLEV